MERVQGQFLRATKSLAHHPNVIIFCAIVLVCPLAASDESRNTMSRPNSRCFGTIASRNMLRRFDRDLQLSSPKMSYPFETFLLNRRGLNLRGGGNQWTAKLDPASGATYYYNAETQETSWTLPTTTELAADPEASSVAPVADSTNLQQFAAATHIADASYAPTDAATAPPVAVAPAAAAPLAALAPTSDSLAATGPTTDRK